MLLRQIPNTRQCFLIPNRLAQHFAARQSWLYYGQQHFHKRAFSSAIWPKQSKYFTSAYMQRHIAQRMRVSAVDLGNTLKRNHILILADHAKESTCNIPTKTFASAGIPPTVALAATFIGMHIQLWFIRSRDTADIDNVTV